MKKIRHMIALPMFALALIPPASARQWNPDARGQALDYTQILHTRAANEVVVLWWVVPESFPAGATPPAVTDVLGRYVVLGLAHIRPNATGPNADNPGAPIIQDQTSRSLMPLAANAMPAEVNQTIAAMRDLARQNLGPMGQAMRWLVFDGSTIHACAPGRMSVPYAGVTYTYDTPIPGCAPR